MSNITEFKQHLDNYPRVLSSTRSYLENYPRLLSLTRSCYYMAMGTYGRIVGLVRNKAIFDDYCRTHPIRKLHLGCGFVELDGWLNTDLLPRRSWVAYCNAAGKFPFPDGSFDYILTEHMIEHVDFDAGLQMLSECKRVLKPGGRIRISTPILTR